MNCGLEVRSCINAILLNSPNNYTTTLRYCNNDLLLLLYSKNFFYIPLVIMIWQCSAIQNGAFVIEPSLILNLKNFS